MVAGYHLIWTAYGWWLPNDPRGSSSHEIRSDVITNLGELHHGRKKVQPTSSDLRVFYENAKAVLKHALLVFDEKEINLIAQSFAKTIAEQRYTCYACAIMPDHVHMLIRKNKHQAEEMIVNLQKESRLALIDKKYRPEQHPVWGGPGWKVFLENCEDFERTIRYIKDNPIKARRPAQWWDFVKPYDGWLPGTPPWLRK
jgi:REP element-mobilizing transposase RayT